MKNKKDAYGFDPLTGEPMDPEGRRILRELDRKLKPRIDAIRASERLTEEDFRITINEVVD